MTDHADEYVPSTETVRNIYGIPGSKNPEVLVEHLAAFDRWLDRVQTEAKAEGYDEGCDQAASSNLDAHECKKHNPYRKGTA